MNAKLSDLLRTCSVKSPYQRSLGKAEGGSVSAAFRISSRAPPAAGLQHGLARRAGDTAQDAVCCAGAALALGPAREWSLGKGAGGGRSVCFQREGLSLLGAWSCCPCELAFSCILQRGDGWLMLLVCV